MFLWRTLSGLPPRAFLPFCSLLSVSPKEKDGIWLLVNVTCPPTLLLHTTGGKLFQSSAGWWRSPGCIHTPALCLGALNAFIYVIHWFLQFAMNHFACWERIPASGYFCYNVIMDTRTLKSGTTEHLLVASAEQLSRAAWEHQDLLLNCLTAVKRNAFGDYNVACVLCSSSAHVNGRKIAKALA